MRTIILLFIIAFGCSAVQAQNIRSMSLEDAVDYAQENSLSIKNSMINIADAEEQIVERKSIGLPQLSAAVDYQYNLIIPKTVVDASNFDPSIPEGTVFQELAFGLKNNLNAGITLQSLLFDASYLTAIKAARAYRGYVDKELLSARRNLKWSVIEAYLPTIILEENKKILKKNINNLEKLFAETQALYKEGFVEQLDVDRLELSLANLSTEVDNLDRQAELVYNVLKFQMGYPIQDEILATDDIDKLLVMANADDLEAEVNYEARAEYQIIMEARRLNELNVDLNKAGYLPSLAAFGTYQVTGQGDNLFKDPVWTDAAIVGLNLSVPIFDGFNKRSKVNRAKLQLELLENQRRDLERAITLEIQNARTAYQNSLERVDSQKRNMALAEKIYETTQIKYKEGIGSSLEITQAEQSLYETQRNYTQAMYDLLVSKTNLDKALGK